MSAEPSHEHAGETGNACPHKVDDLVGRLAEVASLRQEIALLRRLSSEADTWVFGADVVGPSARLRRGETVVGLIDHNAGCALGGKLQELERRMLARLQELAGGSGLERVDDLTVEIVAVRSRFDRDSSADHEKWLAVADILLGAAK